MNLIFTSLSGEPIPCKTMYNVHMSQQSSFLRVLPIPSHNLSEQLLKLKLEERYTVHCVHAVIELSFLFRHRFVSSLMMSVPKKFFWNAVVALLVRL